MRNANFLWALVAILLFLDIYIFQSFKLAIQDAVPRLRTFLIGGYWLLSVLSLGILILLPYIHYENWPRSVRTYVFAIIMGIFFSKTIASVFFLIDDIRRGALWLAETFKWKKPTDLMPGAEGISRSAFLSWLGLAAGSGLFGTLLYGFSNKYNYQLTSVPLRFDHLPEAFRGLKIIHISDIHSGSFTDKQAVAKGVEMIKKAKPDLVLFTGDLVNDRAVEMHHYKDLFEQIDAPLGVYSTLGNHDYGDYVRWESEEAKNENLEKLKQVHADMGWRLLMNEHVVLEREGEKIALLGIENWSAKGRFPKYGRMDLAYPGTEAIPFKILMSHDPSHWDAEVRTRYNDIDLMLSGHTHGMQFGVEIPGIKWSPVQYFYKQWAGLYEEEGQKLYINRGYGFIGYPGRVGILPEITLIEFV